MLWHCPETLRLRLISAVLSVEASVVAHGAAVQSAVTTACLASSVEIASVQQHCSEKLAVTLDYTKKCVSAIDGSLSEHVVLYAQPPLLSSVCMSAWLHACAHAAVRCRAGTGVRSTSHLAVIKAALTAATAASWRASVEDVHRWIEVCGACGDTTVPEGVVDAVLVRGGGKGLGKETPSQSAGARADALSFCIWIRFEGIIEAVLCC